MVVHTIVPETYKFWKSNQPKKLYPTGICLGQPGHVLVLDVDPSGNGAKLLDLRLHYPAQTVCTFGTDDGPVYGQICCLYI